MTYVTVPVIAEFDSSRVIGELKILKSELPLFSNFVFSIGIKVLELGPRGRIASKYELVCASPQTDESYLKYLQSEQYRGVY